MRSAVLGMALVLSAVGCREGAPSPPPAAELVRAGARPTAARTGDLNRDGKQEVVVASVTFTPGGLGAPFLEVFGHRNGDWRRIFDATGNAPLGPPGTPAEMLSAGDGFVAQSVAVLELVDFRGDGAPEIVAAVASAGATSGPVELWVVSMAEGGGLRTEFYRATQRGGEVLVDDGLLTFRFPVYRPGDPGCCPSRLERQTIGYRQATGRIEVLERERTRA